MAITAILDHQLPYSLPYNAGEWRWEKVEEASLDDWMDAMFAQGEDIEAMEELFYGGEDGRHDDGAMAIQMAQCGRWDSNRHAEEET